MRFKKIGKQLKGIYSEQKESYKNFSKKPSLGMKAESESKKLKKKINKNPRFKKLKKGGKRIRSNIDYYFQN